VPQIVIGTAGHIDHGKTALVKALTGTDTDRLAEEKARGMTIDLGFAFLTPNVTIIDVPGHEKFIRNMVAGVATIHIALLVVAADDGVMPQTREHLHILNLLGIPRGIIVVTKTDLAEDPEWVDLVEGDIREMVKGTFLESAPILRTSVNTNEGIEPLREQLIKIADQVEQLSDRGFFRLPVDRVFTKKGFGSVVTGTVLSGRAQVGDALELLPQKEQVKIRGIQSHGLTVESVSMGDRAALNLAGTERSTIKRGVELATPDWIEPSRKFIAQVMLIPASGWELKNRQRLHIHLGTAVVLGRVQIPARKAMKPGQKGNVILHLEEELPTVMDDRFVIRTYSPMITLGGGKILDPNPFFKGKELKEWAVNLNPNPEKRLIQFIRHTKRTPKSAQEWSHIFHQSELWVQTVLEKAGGQNEGGFIFFPEDRDGNRKLILNCLKTFHRNNPYQKGMPTDHLSKETKLDIRWLSYLMSRLEMERVVKTVPGGYAQASHEVNFSEEDEHSAKRIQSQLRTLEFQLVPAESLSEHVDLPSKKVLELLHVLKDQGIVVEVVADRWLLKQKLDELLEKLKIHFQNQKYLSVADFKTLTNTTRKASIPLLEYCDRFEYTERQGDKRTAGAGLN
jgi:selenocysteine-specific elongation factor